MLCRKGKQMTNMPDFVNEKDRQQWLIDNAEYFTVIRRRALKNQRIECPSLAEAEQVAEKWVKADPQARLLLYAVSGVHDVFVKSVLAK